MERWGRFVSSSLEIYRRRGYLTSAEVREVLGLSVEQLKRLVRTGKLVHSNPGSPQRQFSLEAVEAYVKENHG